MIALFNEGRASEVEVKARALVGEQPLLGSAWLILGAALQSQGKPALGALKRAVGLLPENPEAHCNLGVALERLGQLKVAEASYRKALHLRPKYADAHCFLGNTLKAMGRFEEAMGAYASAIKIDPIHEKANCNLGSLYSEVGRLAEAKALCRSALELKPDFGNMHQHLSITLAYLSDYDEVQKESDRALELLGDDPLTWERRLYSLSYHPDLSAEEIFQEFLRWGARFPRPNVDFASHDRNPNRRLRIGYVSPDFRAHSSCFYFSPLFSNHDRESFELFAYSNVETVVDWTRVFQGQFENWRDIWGHPDESVADMIRNDGIDILVDLCGHMSNERLGVFALKPAPIQATWLGSAWTTGLHTIDHVLFDRFMAPEGTLTSESILHLPHSYFVFQPREETAELVPAPCLRNGYITFGYTGRTERLNHRTFSVWGEILKRLPEARLILDYPPFSDPNTQVHYREFMDRHGVDTSRVILRTSPKIFEGLNDIDILFDSFPHGGGTMLMDAFWMGVPAVTLASRPPVGRLGTSMLMNLGLPDWIASTEAEYVERACGFSGDSQALSELRLGMRHRMQNSPLMDGPGFARGVESAYRIMFEGWRKKNPVTLGKVGGSNSVEPGGTP